MELIQSSFQASFDARVERVNAAELTELRTIFRFFDTDSDGAVSADQACRMFALLGLDVNPVYVQDLEEVYLSEFLKIVDSHMPVPPPPPETMATDSVGAESGDPSTADPLQASVSPLIPALRITTLPAAGTGATLAANTNMSAAAAAAVGSEPSDPTAQLVLDEDELRKRNEQLWEDEWKLVDSYHRGSVSLHELRLFLANCGSAIPAGDLLRFVEMYGDSAATLANRDGEQEYDGGADNQDAADDDVFVLTKAGFLKFRREYTERDMRGSEEELSSDDDDGDGEPDGKTTTHHALSVGEGDGDRSENTDRVEQRQSRQKIGDDDGTSSISSSRRHSLIVVDPGVIDASHFDVDEDESEDDEDEGEDDEDEGEDGDLASQL